MWNIEMRSKGRYDILLTIVARHRGDLACASQLRHFMVWSDKAGLPVVAFRATFAAESATDKNILRYAHKKNNHLQVRKVYEDLVFEDLKDCIDPSDL
jgi:hypothetical protein